MSSGEYIGVASGEGDCATTPDPSAKTSNSPSNPTRLLVRASAFTAPAYACFSLLYCHSARSSTRIDTPASFARARHVST